MPVKLVIVGFTLATVILKVLLEIPPSLSVTVTVTVYVLLSA